VEVGYTTLISGEGKLEVGKGPVRTGVTAILPRGRDAMNDPVFAGYFSLNGNGEMTGTAWVEESGFLEGPIVLTNTHSVGVARDAVIAWRLAHGGPDAEGFAWSLPWWRRRGMAGSTTSMAFMLNRNTSRHAIETAQNGAIEEGASAAATGMICYEFKGGTGTASRMVPVAAVAARGSSETKQFAIGVLVQANSGRRPQLTIRGLEVGKKIPGSVYKQETGSIIIVVATDAPLLPHQLKRLARRASLGLARTGSVSGNGSGDLFIAFSTANPHAADAKPPIRTIETMPNDLMDPLFTATVEATEEAIINALVDNRDMIGRDNHKVQALPHDRLRALFQKYSNSSD
jgi:L-aminopeptidase/D-esterase-like protein